MFIIEITEPYLRVYKGVPYQNRTKKYKKFRNFGKFGKNGIPGKKDL